MADDEEIDIAKLEEECKAVTAQMEALQREFQQMKEACQMMQKDIKESEGQLKKHHALIKDLD
jgi:hypothetical protein